MRSGVRLAIVGLRSGLARRRDAAIEIDTGDGRWGEQGGRDEGGEATGLRECPSSQKCMENDADHNVGRMKLDHAPAQVAPPWFLVTRAAVLRHSRSVTAWSLFMHRSVTATDLIRRSRYSYYE